MTKPLKTAEKEIHDIQSDPDLTRVLGPFKITAFNRVDRCRTKSDRQKIKTIITLLFGTSALRNLLR